MMMLMNVSSDSARFPANSTTRLRLQLLRLPSPYLLAGLHFHQLLLHNLIFFQEKERGIYIQSTSNSEADSTVLQSLGRTTRAIETQHRARLGNHTKQSIHSATTTNPPNNQGALMARVHKLLRIPISLFFLRYFLDIGIVQQLLHSTSFLQSLKSPNPRPPSFSSSSSSSSFPGVF